MLFLHFLSTFQMGAIQMPPDFVDILFLFREQ